MECYPCSKYFFKLNPHIHGSRDKKIFQHGPTYQKNMIYKKIFIIGEGMKPRFIDEMRNITVEVGRDITFTCTVSDIHVSTFNRHLIVYR